MPGFLERLLSPSVLVGLSTCSGVLFLVSLVGASWAVRRLPADYLLTDDSRPPARGMKRALLFIRNALGGILLVLGVLMLVLPGQGLLTILAAFSLMDFRGKRRIEHRLMVIPSVLKAINRLRHRSGRPPLQVPGAPATAGGP
jgi:hypothetical protein